MSPATAKEGGESSKYDSTTAPRILTACRTLSVVCLATAVTAAGVLLCSLARPRSPVDPRQSEPVGRFDNGSSLRFVAALFRHGDRTPTFNYKTDPLANAFPEKKGDLTKRGKQHMHKKGQIFRSFYNGFLSDLYMDNEIIIKTTNLPRTYMSAAMVSSGLYPPRDYQKWSDLETVWQPIPIHHDSPEDSSLYSHPGICPAFDSLKDKTSYPLVVDSFDNNITVPLLSYLSEKCGQPITKENAYYLYDTFNCQESADLQLPEWLKPNYLQTLKSIFQNNKASEIIFGNPKRQKLIIGRLLQEIILQMELCSNNTESRNTSRKMHLYSGHDISVGYIMGFMKTFTKHIGFGASVHFHLNFDEQIGYTVKVFYFDRWDDTIGREVTIPSCGDHCKLQEFIQLVRDGFPRKWEEECQIIEE